MTRPWAKVPIQDCGESLQSLKNQFFCIEPHPYLSIGAPYDKKTSPWMLRSGLINLLFEAQNKLTKKFPNYCLAIFDAWRPLAVQSFMVEYSINQECIKRGLDPQSFEQTALIDEVVRDVSRFWAPASLSHLTPPPHSTGGAIDLTLYDNSRGHLIDMGGEIDEIGSISTPDYFSNKDNKDFNSKYYLWDSRRKLLSEIMISVGFVQHPNEWWHFSYGDQLWAWKKNSSLAIYGRVDLAIK